VIGNGSLQVMFDATYRLRDLYFPNLGKENHTVGHPCRFGVFADGRLSWTDSPEWERRIGYEPDALVSDVTLTHRQFGLVLHVRDAVDFHENIYVREIAVTNGTSSPRDVRLFFHQDFHLYGSEVGDTALYDPRLNAILHYKGRRYLLVNVMTPTRAGVEEWAIGVKEFQSAEGTWRDAEDGLLARNPIAQGSVDSTIGLRVQVPAGGRAASYYWITAGMRFNDVKTLNSVVLGKTPAALLGRTRDFWTLWATKSLPEFDGLAAEAVALYKRSLLVLHALTDNLGGIIAANDSDLLQFGRDTYSYVWPRDGARAAYALVRAGYIDLPRNFFRFCANILTDDGYLLHKYNPDGSLGSSWHPWLAGDQSVIPIQEDETASVLWALWQHFLRYRDVDFIRPLLRPFVIRAADFLEAYRAEDTGLPHPSWDLWEERWGVHTYTVAAVFGGLSAAAQFARAFGEHGLAAKYLKAAGDLQHAAKNVLYSAAEGRFGRTFDPATARLDLTLDASLSGVAAFGLFPGGDPMVTSTMEQVARGLAVRTDVGGIARYERDPFLRVTDDFERVPGNPWIPCTLWLAQYRISTAGSSAELRAAGDLLAWVAGQARPTGLLPEQLHPLGREAVSVCPLSWSHAEFVITVRDYLDRQRQLSAWSPPAPPSSGPARA
jgi:GH15 family glucan-1,4-alpha-glucosidase